MNHPTLEEARAAKKRAASVFKSFAPVAGVGLTREKEGYGLKVNLQTSPQGREPLPTDVDGVPVRVEVVGRIEKRTSTKVRTRIARISR
ncbi:MAG: hypothetical protein INR62_08565 [Rhodospirillales bacterium]|nr:hypothetical protein [Acetobacter sp.]